MGERSESRTKQRFEEGEVTLKMFEMSHEKLLFYKMYTYKYVSIYDHLTGVPLHGELHSSQYTIDWLKKNKSQCRCEIPPFEQQFTGDSQNSVSDCHFS